jgi:hypothetical protein
MPNDQTAAGLTDADAMIGVGSVADDSLVLLIEAFMPATRTQPRSFFSLT